MKEMTEEEKKAKYEELKTIAHEYAIDKITEKSLKDRLETNNSNIKALMELLDIDEVPLGNGSVVSYQVSKTDKPNETKMISVLKMYAPDTKCIKTKEYIDTDVLEGEIYHDKLSEECMQALDNCITTTMTPKLVIKKTKKGK